MARSQQRWYQKAKHLRVKESVLRRNAEGQSSYKTKRFKNKTKHTRERERERLFQHKELSDLEGTYLSASPTSNPISENGIPVSGAINLESKESSFLGHI